MDQSSQLIRSSIDIGKTEVFYGKDNNNIAPNDLPLNVWGVNQSIQFPTIYGAQRKVMKTKSLLTKNQYAIDEQLLKKEVSKVYYEILYWQSMQKNYKYLDSLYVDFARAADLKYKQGESNYLEKLTAETKGKEVNIQLTQIQESIQKSYIQLNQWLQTDEKYVVDDLPMERIPLQLLDTANNPALNYYENATKLSTEQLKLERQKLLPDLNASVFNGTNNGEGDRSFSGFQVGVAIPLWFGTQKSKIQAAKTGASIMESESKNFKVQLTSKYDLLQSDMRKFEKGIEYYETSGKRLAQETLFHARKAFRSGEINFLQYTQLLDNTKSIESEYLYNLLQYNLTVLEANYLMN
jgi:cobalt-zinc-cadmium resistance protein CzcA